MPWFRGTVRYGDDEIRVYKVEAPDVGAARELVGDIARGLLEPDARDDLTPDELGDDCDIDFDGVFPMEENDG